MNIKLLKLSITSFKGIESFTFEPNGDDAALYGQNGAGKTTVFDAFLWLLFGKDSDGKAEFGLRPLDGNNHAIKGLVLAVEADLTIDGGEIITIRKEHHEKVVKGQIRGYETICTVDEVPKKKGEYEAFIAEIIDEDIFKMLTDLQAFNNLHWARQRGILMDIAGEIGTPKGFSALLKKMGRRTLDEYKKVLSDQKKAYGKERDEINPRLDEIHKRLEVLGDADGALKTAGDTRVAAIKKKADLEEQKKKLYEQEALRQGKIDKVNEFKNQKVLLEARLSQPDPTKIAPLLREKLSWDDKMSDKQGELHKARLSYGEAESAVKNTEGHLLQKRQRLNIIRESYIKLRGAELGATCSACGQKLPADKIVELQDHKAIKMEESADVARALKVEVKEFESIHVVQMKHFDKAAEAVKAAEQSLTELETARFEAHAKLDKQIEALKTGGADPETDDEWIRLDGWLKIAEKTVGESMAAGLGVIDKQVANCQTVIDAANGVLAGKDRIKKDRERIGDLEEREKELAQLIADIEAELAKTDEYVAAESKLIEESVNAKFKHVEFKLFNRRLNESIEPTCQAMLQGTPYSDLSTGERIFVGIDIVNVLSGFYDASVVLFVDRRESLTMELETNAQVISLYADKGAEVLTVKKE